MHTVYTTHRSHYITRIGRQYCHGTGSRTSHPECTSSYSARQTGRRKDLSMSYQERRSYSSNRCSDPRLFCVNLWLEHTKICRIGTSRSSLTCGRTFQWIGKYRNVDQDHWNLSFLVAHRGSTLVVEFATPTVGGDTRTLPALIEFV